jgi:stage IV sporulation protein FA
MKMFDKKKYLTSLFTRLLLVVIFLLLILIINKYNHTFITKFKNNLFNKTFNFIKVNKISQKILGKDVFYYQNNKDIESVLSNSFDANIKEKYLDSEKLSVSLDLPIGSISSGVVVYIGNKDSYGSTIIIQGVDGYNIWYGNVKDINVGLYDYVEEHNLIASANGEYIYLLIEKDNKYFTYDEYIQSKS